jgi:DNA polymerase III subunit epsilon
MPSSELRLEAPLAIVDLETTGGSPSRDRITEIAVLEIDAFEITSEWSTLVNPETTIPAEIQFLTGITNDMVAGAPRFAGLAEALFERLDGRVFVAHNARFDYGFLRHELERAGFKFHAKTLCSVRLSRRLYPEHRRHDLDSLIERHGLDCRARHRALGDANALWQFLRTAAADHGPEILAVAARQIARRTALPPHIERSMIDAIPEAPGVYFFYGESPAPLYIGKSVNLRQRVLSHFSADLRSEKEMHLAREVRNIEWQRTAGELGALLREARLVKELAPSFNRLHHARFGAAFRRYRTAEWTYPGPLGIVEKDRAGESTEVHVVDRWCYLGTANSDAELAELLEARRSLLSSAQFDYDHYRILARHLGKRGVRVVELQG